jgi:hypothetical protein
MRRVSVTVLALTACAHRVPVSSKVLQPVPVVETTDPTVQFTASVTESEAGVVVNADLVHHRTVTTFDVYDVSTEDKYTGGLKAAGYWGAASLATIGIGVLASAGVGGDDLQASRSTATAMYVTGGLCLGVAGWQISTPLWPGKNRRQTVERVVKTEEPNDEPIEGVPIEASAGEDDFIGTTSTGDDGRASFMLGMGSLPPQVTMEGLVGGTLLTSEADLTGTRAYADHLRAEMTASIDSGDIGSAKTWLSEPMSPATRQELWTTWCTAALPAMSAATGDGRWQDAQRLVEPTLQGNPACIALVHAFDGAVPNAGSTARLDYHRTMMGIPVQVGMEESKIHGSVIRSTGELREAVELRGANFGFGVAIDSLLWTESAGRVKAIFVTFHGSTAVQTMSDFLVSQYGAPQSSAKSEARRDVTEIWEGQQIRLKLIYNYQDFKARVEIAERE